MRDEGGTFLEVKSDTASADELDAPRFLFALAAARVYLSRVST